MTLKCADGSTIWSSQTPCSSASMLSTKNKLTKLRDIRDSLWSLEAAIGQMECLLEAALNEISDMLKDIERILNG